MKAKFCCVLLIMFFIISCEKEEVQDEVNLEDTLVYEEFFKGELAGKKFEIKDPESMAAAKSIGFESGIPALGIFAYEEGWGEMGIYFCFYNGVGSYTTGNKKDVGYSYFWADDGNFWEDLPQMDNPSDIEITYADDDIVEGTFDVTAYNVDDTTDVIDFSGSFGLILEKKSEEEE